MDLIFLCGLFPKNRENEIFINSKSVVHKGPNELQWTFVRGLKKHFTNFTIITTPLLSNYPKRYKKLYFLGSLFEVNPNVDGICLGSIRLPIIGLLSKFLNILYFLIKKYTSHNEMQILIYSVHLPYLISAALFKTLNKNSKICLFVNDLPQYMSGNNNKIYLYLKSIELYIFKILQKQVDSYVFVTNQTNDLVNINHKPWILIEGVFDINEEDSANFNPLPSDKKIILYTGTLDSRYGLKDLLNTFELIEDTNYELWICGDGDLRNEIVQKVKTNYRVKYFGMLNHKEIVAMQQKASVLVNPRKAIGEYTKYSFPIKTLEYLASNRPCVMYDLPGIPREYLDFFITPTDNTNIALKEKIIEVCEWIPEKRSEFCQAAKDFIKQNKSSEIQFKKLYTLLSNFHA